ncbi:MAG: hypothetical protein M0006_01390 [Magnetospirillum sp.]|nr:hypothetical protein [Magnetospirillum sp.]
MAQAHRRPTKSEDGHPVIGFALGGLAGNNAHGAGFLQAALDEGVTPDLISCTSGQILWVYRYLLARSQHSPTLEERLRTDIRETRPFRQLGADMMMMATQGKPGVFRLAGYEIAMDVAKNMLATAADMMANWREHGSFEEYLNWLPARTLVPLFPDKFFSSISDAFNAADLPILFNSYDPHQGIEFVHLNEAAKKTLGIAPGTRKSYRDRTIYRDVSPNYIRDGLWIYQYGFEGRFNAIDGAYYRQILLSELSGADIIFVARPINYKWQGELPKSYAALEDMKTEIAFNGSYEGERDKIVLINKLMKEGVLKDRDGKAFHHIELVEVEMTGQRSFFDYIFESGEVFDHARATTLHKFENAFRGADYLEAPEA